MSVSPELSVVISSFGNYEGLRRVLDGYERQTAAPGSFEVLVVLDRADPEPARADAAIGERPYPLRRLRGQIPGLSANRNAGLRQGTDLVLFTDNDTIPEPRLVSEHLAWHSRSPEDEAAVLGHVRWARELSVTPFMHWLDHGIQFDFPFIAGVDAGWGRFYGANVSVKKAFAERVGGFDEDRLPYGYEDLDFGYRAGKLGLRLLYNRKAVVEHLREFDLEFFKRRVRRTAIAEREFIRKHPELEPYFFRMFSHAQTLPPASGRGRHLIRAIPRRLPLLGPRIWRSADIYYRQQLAPHFLDAWEEAASAPAREGPTKPLVDELGELERSASSGGSEPAGPN